MVHYNNSNSPENVFDFSEFLKEYQIGILAVFAFVALIFLLKVSKKEGYNSLGQFDAEPPTKNTPNDDGNGGSSVVIPDNTSSGTYESSPISMRFFKIDEFDSHGSGENGSGVKMRISTLQMLDQARAIAGISFKINSGYRTPTWNKHVGGVSDSSHLYGYAADISATSEAQRNKILKALYDVGFRRFGVAKSFIHVDNDPSKNSPAIWNYDGFKITYNPLEAVA